MCYKNELVCKRSLKYARIIQRAFVHKYLDHVSRVLLTPGNLREHLMTIVQFREQQEGEDINEDDDEETDNSNTSVGILTNYKVIKEEGREEVLLFISLFASGKSRPGRTIAWVRLSDTEVYADLSLGLVSQKWLEKFQIHDSADGSSKFAKPKGSKPSLSASAPQSINKLRQLQMLNWQESQAEKNKVLQLEEIPVEIKLEA